MGVGLAGTGRTGQACTTAFPAADRGGVAHSIDNDAQRGLYDVAGIEQDPEPAPHQHAAFVVRTIVSFALVDHQQQPQHQQQQQQQQQQWQQLQQ